MSFFYFFFIFVLLLSLSSSRLKDTDNGGDSENGKATTDINGNGFDHQPTTDDRHENTTEDYHQPTIDDGRQPTTDDGRQPTTEDGRQPTTEDGRPHTTEDGRLPTTEDGRQPTTDDGRQPTTDGGRQPTTEDFQQPTSDVEPTAPDFDNNPWYDNNEEDVMPSDSKLENEKDRVENNIAGRTPHSRYLASIRIADSFNNNNFTHRCSGSLVTTTVVVSVAHCLHDQFGNFILQPETYRILFGRSNFDSDAGAVYVSKVAIHRRYLVETRLHDLSMFKLKEPQRVLLPELNFLRAENLPNTTKCDIHFWSKLEYMDNKDVVIFLTFKVALEDRLHCFFELGTSQHYLTPDHKCFYMPRSATPACLYNGGSPITCADILVGLFSFSTYSQQSEILADTGVYVDISRYVDKISDFHLDIDKACRWYQGLKEIFIVILLMYLVQNMLFE